MFNVIGLIVMPEECVIEPGLQNDRHQRQRNGEQRQNAERARRQMTRIDGDQHQPERAVDHAADSEDQRMLNRLFDLVVYRGRYSRLRRTADRISAASVNAAAARLTYIETKNVAGV